MSNLLNVLPLDQKISQIPKDHNNVKTLEKISTFVEIGNSLFSRYFDQRYSTDLKRIVADKEYDMKKELWNRYEEIPKEYSHTIVLSDKSNQFPEAIINYPVTYVDKIIKIADKINMVILPIEYVDLDQILDAHKINRYSNIRYSIKNGKECIDQLGGQMYILCPLSYYSFWNEITSEEVIEKYYPEKFEAIFTTIELMTPSQKNLYQMSKTNKENIHQIQKDLEINLKQIGEKLKKIESRISNIEDQIMALKEKYDKVAAENEELKSRLTEINLERQRYSLLDPIVFFTKNQISDFNSDLSNIKAHVVTCFGPEFPEEFFIMNGLTIFK